MAAGEFHRISHAAGPAACADAGVIDTGLSDEPRERRIQVARPCLIQLPLHVRVVELESRSAAFAEPRLSIVSALIPAALSCCATGSHDVRVVMPMCISNTAGPGRAAAK